MATTIPTILCMLALTLSAWAAPTEDAAKVPVHPAQVTAQLQIQPAAPEGTQDASKETVYSPSEGEQHIQPAIVLANAPLEATDPGQEPLLVPAVLAQAQGGAVAEGDLAASPDANPADGEPTADLDTANSFWRGYGGGGYGGGWGGGYGGWGGYRPYYGGGWRHHGWGRGWGGGYGGWGGYRGGYWG